MKKRYWLGIDAGGSRSSIIAIDEEGNLVHKVVGHSIHAGRLKTSETVRRVAKLVQELLSELDEVKPIGLGVGLAGAGRSAIRQKVAAEVGRQLPSIPLTVASDAETSYYASFRDESGILVISGTGSIAMGKDQEGWKRTGGYGYKIGDPGSGYQLGQKMLFYISEYYSKNNSFPDVVSDEYEINDLEHLLEKLYVDDESPAKFAPMLIDGVKNNDAECTRILDEELNLLAIQVQTLTQKMDDFSGQIALGGGLNSDDFYLEKLKKHIQSVIPDISWADWVEEPAYGSCYLAQKELVQTEQFR